jgi:hypothetical protein
VSYNSRELLALVAPLWGLSMDDLERVTIAAFTKDDRIVYADSSVGRYMPGAPALPAASATPADDARIAMHLIRIAHDIVAKFAQPDEGG